MAIGSFRDTVIAFVFAPLRTEAISLASMRYATRKEPPVTKLRTTPKPLTDADEAEIQRQAAGNPDAAEATDADMAQARPFATAFPELADSIKRVRGRPPVETPRQHASLRLDADVLEKFKATGKGWQSRINQALRDAEV